MKEFTETALLEPPTTGSLIDHLRDNVARAPESIAIRRKTIDGWQDLTYRAFHNEVRAIAKGIISAGVEPGDRIAIMSSTRYEWTVADYAIWYVGAVPVPIYETSSAEQVEWILSDSGAVGVFLEGPKHVRRTRRHRGRSPARTLPTRATVAEITVFRRARGAAMNHRTG